MPQRCGVRLNGPRFPTLQAVLGADIPKVALKIANIEINRAIGSVVGPYPLESCAVFEIHANPNGHLRRGCRSEKRFLGLVEAGTDNSCRSCRPEPNGCASKERYPCF